MTFAYDDIFFLDRDIYVLLVRVFLFPHRFVLTMFVNIETISVYRVIYVIDFFHRLFMFLSGRSCVAVTKEM